ncbi:hypothetical protein [Paenarthrobacter aurescens]|uniref:Uncharacterized protein n=1 Tax=Paenarthrobacter aurescens (strain TC1) TaxID=290340 RepID=A1RCC5_PAEAT|nr:hypothetical protein [Paenarthrobacter aurescens]ABM10546.1 hypothetical protein AAur_pTC10013 [Paenarthrobacter aurescens TC1]
MLFAVCADRGAPGSSTVARVLASARGLPAVVVGADAYGDDMALRVLPDGKHPMPETPTVLGIGAGKSAERPRPTGPIVLAEQGSRPRYEDLWREGSHELSPLVRVVPGFQTAEQGASASWQVLAAALEAQNGAVFADLGRIHTGSPSMPIAAAADAIIPVCRGDQISVQTMVARLELLVSAIAERNRRPPIVVPVVIADRRHGDAIAQAVAKILSDSAVAAAVRGVAWLAWDPAGVADLDNGRDPWEKPLRKSPLMRSARKAMWHLGLATGLDHEEPNVKPAGGKCKRARTTASPGEQLRTNHAAELPQAAAPAPPLQPGWSRQVASGESSPSHVSPIEESHR